jgi:hypothetical protein
MDDLMWLWWQDRHPRSPAIAPPFNLEATQAQSQSEPGGSPLPVSQASATTAEVLPDDTALRSYEIPATPVTVAFQPQGSPSKFLWRGVLSRYDGRGVDERTRTVPCRVVVHNPRDVQMESSVDAAGPPALMRGMFVSIHIHATPQTSFVLVPEAAIQPGKKLFRVRDGKLEMVGPLSLVQLVEPSSGTDDCLPGNAWIVHTGNHELRAGDHVVASPLPAAYHGMPVKERSSP